MNQITSTNTYLGIDISDDEMTDTDIETYYVDQDDLITLDRDLDTLDLDEIVDHMPDIEPLGEGAFYVTDVNHYVMNYVMFSQRNNMFIKIEVCVPNWEGEFNYGTLGTFTRLSCVEDYRVPGAKRCAFIEFVRALSKASLGVFRAIIRAEGERKIF